MIGEATLEETKMTFDVLAGHIGNFNPEDDKKLHAEFLTHPSLNDAKSRDEGRPIYEMAEYIRISIPGDRDNIIQRPVRPEDLDRFPTQYARFKNKNAAVEGTPLSTWGVLNLAQIEELKFFNIFTVEQLAGVSDGNIQRFMGLAMLRNQAKTYLDVVKEKAPMNKLQAELAKRDEQIATMLKQIQDLQARIEE